jgi:hypothetical protein
MTILLPADNAIHPWLERGVAIWQRRVPYTNRTNSKKEKSSIGLVISDNFMFNEWSMKIPVDLLMRRLSPKALDIVFRSLAGKCAARSDQVRG